MNRNNIRGVSRAIASMLATTLLLSACGSGAGQSNASTSAGDSAVMETVSVPEQLYTWSGARVETPSEDEQKQVIAALEDVLDFKTLWDEGVYYDIGQTQYPTETDGAISYTGGSVKYIDGTPCAVAESMGEATRIEVLDVAEAEALSMAYEMDGQSYTVEEAIDYVNTLWTESMAVYSVVDQAQVRWVIVYQREDGSYAYVLLMDKYVQGLAIEQYSTALQASAFDSGGFWPSFIVVEMDAPEHIYYYCEYYPVAAEEMQLIENDILTQEEAIQRADEVLATYADYDYLEISLRYGCYLNTASLSDEEWNSQTFHYRPYWCIVLEWDDTAGGEPANYLPNVTLYIDAVTGTAYLLDSISYTEIQISN